MAQKCREILCTASANGSVCKQYAAARACSARNFPTLWAAYDLISCGWLQTFQKKALAKNRSRDILHWMESAFSNYLLSFSKRLQRPNWFLPLWKQLKSTLGPRGLCTSQHWPLHHRANRWTGTHFSFYHIGFFHSETNVKEPAAQPRIDHRPFGLGRHSTTTAPTWIFYLNLPFSFALDPIYFKVI